MDSASYRSSSRGGEMTSASIDVSETCNGLAERAAVLHYYAETAATVLGGVLPNGLQQGEKHDPALVGALVLAQAVMESADACTARLERIADTLDDLADSIERRADGSRVSVLARDEMLTNYVEQAATDTARMLALAIEVVASQLETVLEVEPYYPNQSKRARALEIAAKRYPEQVAMVLDATTQIYAAQIVALSMARGGCASD